MEEVSTGHSVAEMNFFVGVEPKHDLAPEFADLPGKPGTRSDGTVKGSLRPGDICFALITRFPEVNGAHDPMPGMLVHRNVLRPMILTRFAAGTSLLTTVLEPVPVRGGPLRVNWSGDMLR